jgi:hypothetical protein
MKNIKIVIAIFALALLSAVGVTLVHANPSFFYAGAVSASATSTVAYMTPGTGTTTIQYDTYTATGNTQATDRAALALQFTASSTNSTLLINLEYSEDGIDWYQDAITTITATTTRPVLLAPVNQFKWTFASSTAGIGAVASTTNRDTRIITIPTPTRYVRALMSLQLGGTNGAVWGKVIPVKERN